MSLLPLDVPLVLGVGEVNGPVGALPRVVLAPGHLAETLVEGEVVTDGVLNKQTSNNFILTQKIFGNTVG